MSNNKLDQSMQSVEAMGSIKIDHAVPVRTHTPSHAVVPDQEQQPSVTCRKLLLIGIATIGICAALYALVKYYSDSSIPYFAPYNDGSVDHEVWRSQPEIRVHSSELWLTVPYFLLFSMLSFMVILVACATSACVMLCGKEARKKAVEAERVLQELRRDTKSDASLAIPVAPFTRRNRRNCPTAMGQEPPPFYGELTGMVLPAVPKKPEADVRPLPATLAELYNGAVKKVEYKRRVLQSDDTTAEELASLHITIKPGWEDGMPVIFPSAGDEGVGIEPADVEFVVDTVADPAWSREGSTLFYSAEVSLSDALCGSVLAVPTLDGRTLSVPITQIVTPGATQTVPGEGMPTEGGKGDLVIKFVTIFPKTLTLAQKAAVKKALA